MSAGQASIPLEFEQSSEESRVEDSEQRRKWKFGKSDQLLLLTSSLYMLQLRQRTQRSVGSARRYVSNKTVASVGSIATVEPVPSAAEAKWTPNSVRTGLIARKRGMTSIWTDQGARNSVTVLQVSSFLSVI